MNPTPATTARPITGLKSIAYFRDGTGRCCDRCGTFIKNVALVSLKDGTMMSYGSECIEKVLAGDNSLLKLWKTNYKLLQKWQRYLEILSRPVDQIPFDKRGYYDRGVFFVCDDEQKGICCGMRYNLPSSGRLIVHSGCNIFHPTHITEPALSRFDGRETFDMRGPTGGSAWERYTLENWQKHCLAHLEAHKAWLAFEIDRIGKFLARILEKGLITQQQAQQVQNEIQPKTTED